MISPVFPAGTEGCSNVVSKCCTYVVTRLQMEITVPLTCKVVAASQKYFKIYKSDMITTPCN